MPSCCLLALLVENRLIFVFWALSSRGKREDQLFQKGKGRPATPYESCGSIHGEIFMNQRLQKRISSAWRPEFRRKGTFFDKNATKSDFERAPSDISAIPTHLDGSRGPVQDQKIQKKLKCPGLVIGSPQDVDPRSADGSVSEAGFRRWDLIPAHC